MMSPEGLRDAVVTIMRDAATTEILPRFRNLAAEDISVKSHPGDLVTAADVAAEGFLEGRLSAMTPGCAFVGEEGVEAVPSRLDALLGAAPVWVIDPIDGTRNYARGEECFAVIVALVEGGETQAGWIYDPIADVACWAHRGHGAWISEGDGWQSLTIPAMPPVQHSVGSLPKSLRDRQLSAGWPGKTTRYFCCGQEYMDVLRGKLNYAVYGGKLKPWDHAAGVLMVEEAGGFTQLIDGEDYTPIRIVKNRRLLLAPDAETWQSLRHGLDGLAPSS